MVLVPVKNPLSTLPVTPTKQPSNPWHRQGNEAVHREAVTIWTGLEATPEEDDQDCVSDEMDDDPPRQRRPLCVQRMEV